MACASEPVPPLPVQEPQLCASCFEIFTQSNPPKLLKCGHVFCVNCLVAYFHGLSKLQDNQYVCCPVCMEITNLDLGGVTDLPTQWELIYETKKLDSATSRELFGQNFDLTRTIVESVGPAGGTISLPDYDVSLTIPERALTKDVDITISTVSPVDAQPPINDDDFQLIGPIVSLEPNNLQFLKPPLLTVGHSAVQLTRECLQVWTKLCADDYLNTNPNQPKTTVPYVEIIKQPQKELRFRYESEGLPRRLPEQNSTIKIHNYHGPVKVRASLVSREKTPRPHPYRLVGKNCENGICELTEQAPEKMQISFHLGIERVKQIEFINSLQTRKSIGIDAYQWFKHSSINLDKCEPKSLHFENVVCICFEVFVNPSQNHTGFNSLQPVMTNPIFNKMFEDVIREVINSIEPDEFQHLFHNLWITQQDIEFAEKNADTSNTRSKSRAVLRWWKDTEGKSATRERLLEAKRKVTRSMEVDYSERDMAEVSESDLVHVTKSLTSDKLQNLYHILGIKQQDIERVKRNADTSSKARAVLRWWKKKEGRDATCDRLLEAKRKVEAKRKRIPSMEVDDSERGKWQSVFDRDIPLQTEAVSVHVEDKQVKIRLGHFSLWSFFSWRRSTKRQILPYMERNLLQSHVSLLVYAIDKHNAQAFTNCMKTKEDTETNEFVPCCQSLAPISYTIHKKKDLVLKVKNVTECQKGDTAWKVEEQKEVKERSCDEEGFNTALNKEGEMTSQATSSQFPDSEKISWNRMKDDETPYCEFKFEKIKGYVLVEDISGKINHRVNSITGAVEVKQDGNDAIKFTFKHVDMEATATGGLIRGFGQLAIADTSCQPDDDGHFKLCHVKQALNLQEKQNLDKCYDMTTREKGYAFILNLDRTYDDTQQHLRTGSGIDVVNITSVLKKVGFRVQKHIDILAENIKEEFEGFVQMWERMIKAKDPLKCIPVVLMAHGGYGYIVCQPRDKTKLTKDELKRNEKEIELDYFFKRLENSTILENIPKIFIIVSCRNLGRAGQYCEVSPPKPHVIRIYSTLQGQITTRVGGKGTIFIQALTKIILENAHRDDLLTIMRKVRSYAEELREKAYKERNLPDKPYEIPSWEENLSSDKELYLIADSETGTS